MDKIKMTTPLVEMDGDEMTRIPVSYTHLLGYGIVNLIQTCVEFFPSPIRDNVKIFGKDPRTDKEYNVDFDSRRPFSAYVFKTIVDPFIGRYSLIKVCSGELKSDSVIYNYEDVYKRQI